MRRTIKRLKINKTTVKTTVKRTKSKRTRTKTRKTMGGAMHSNVNESDIICTYRNTCKFIKPIFRTNRAQLIYNVLVDSEKINNFIETEARLKKDRNIKERYNNLLRRLEGDLKFYKYIVNRWNVSKKDKHKKSKLREENLPEFNVGSGNPTRMISFVLKDAQELMDGYYGKKEILDESDTNTSVEDSESIFDFDEEDYQNPDVFPDPYNR